MNRLILIILAASISIMASAQHAKDPQGMLSARGARIYSDGVKLTTDQSFALFSDFGGYDRGSEYLKNRQGYRTGVGLSVGGAATFVVGLPASYIATAFAIAYGFSTIGGGEVPKGVEIAVYGTYGITLAGAAMMIAGIPTASVYRHRIKKVTAEYNSTVTSSKPVVTFSPARSGFGIAMNF